MSADTERLTYEVNFEEQLIMVRSDGSDILLLNTDDILRLITLLGAIRGGDDV